MTVFLVVWAICGTVGVLLAERRGHSKWLGLALGLILGVFGLLIIVLIPVNKTIGLIDQGPVSTGNRTNPSTHACACAGDKAGHSASG